MEGGMEGAIEGAIEGAMDEVMEGWSDMADYAAGRPGSRQWAILAVLTMVAFVTNVDATIVVVALPKLTTGLHTSVTVGLWTLTAYIITSTVLLLPAGRLSDVLGGKPVLLAGLAIFTVATVLCGVAPSGADLVAARFLQGVGGRSRSRRPPRSSWTRSRATASAWRSGSTPPHGCSGRSSARSPAASS